MARRCEAGIDGLRDITCNITDYVGEASGLAGDIAEPRECGGTVNLPNGGPAKTGGFPLALRGDAQFGDLAPDDHRLGTKRPIAR